MNFIVEYQKFVLASLLYQREQQQVIDSM